MYGKGITDDRRFIERALGCLREFMEDGGQEFVYRRFTLRQIAAEDWRGRFFDPKDRRGRDRSKLATDVLARGIIEWSGAPGLPSLRHAAAVAILIGLWGVLEAGWLEWVPAGLSP